MNRGFTQDQIDAQSLNLKGRYNKQVFEENQKLLGMESVITHLQSYDIWEIPYFKDLYTEDNDTDEEEEKEEDEVWEGRIVESFVAKEKDILKKKAAKRKNATEVQSKKAKKIVDIIERYKLEESQIMRSIVSLNKDDPTAEGIHLGIGDNTLIAAEYVGI